MTDTSKCDTEAHDREGGCYNCCEDCNYDHHICPGCGGHLSHDGKLLDTSLSAWDWHKNHCKAGAS